MIVNCFLVVIHLNPSAKKKVNCLEQNFRGSAPPCFIIDFAVAEPHCLLWPRQTGLGLSIACCQKQWNFIVSGGYDGQALLLILVVNFLLALI